MKKVFLVGFMGAGKTLAGRKLSTLLNLPFIDMDEQIAEKAGVSVSELFRTRGEAAFRKLEQEELKLLTADPQPAVVATGGGTPCFFDNMRRMNDSGYTIYIRESANELFDRLQADESNQISRPLFATLSRPLTLQNVVDLLDARKSYYEQSHVICGFADLFSSELLTKLSNLYTKE